MAVDPWVEKVRRACVYLANVDGHVSLARLAARLGGSPYHLQRSFKRLVGVTPREYADACRLQKVKRRLRKGARVTAAMLDAGYGSSSRFYEGAVRKLAMSPAAYRRGGTGMRLRYAIVESPLGRLLVAATDRGVCGLDGVVRPGAQTRARARIPGGDPAARRQRPCPMDEGDSWPPGGPAAEARSPARRASHRVSVAGVDRARRHSRTATLVRMRRWRRRLAGRQPRAVARACATNPVALAIPCHRVVPSAGGTGGYRWGVSRKKALLAAEHKIQGR